MSEEIVKLIDQRYLYEFLLSEAGIEDSMCIGVDPEEIARRLLRGDCVGFAQHPSGLVSAVMPKDPDADTVGASDFDLGPDWEFVRFLAVQEDGRCVAVRDLRVALCIAVSRAFASDDLPEELHASEAQVLLLNSGLPWEPRDIDLLKEAAAFGAGASRELYNDEAEDLVTRSEEQIWRRTHG